MNNLAKDYFKILGVELIDNKAVLSISDAIAKLVPLAPKGSVIGLQVGDTYGNWGKLTHASLIEYDGTEYDIHLTDGEWE